MTLRYYQFQIGSLQTARLPWRHGRPGRVFAVYSQDPSYAERVARRYLRMFARRAALTIRRGTMAWAENAGWYEAPRLVVVSSPVDDAGIIRSTQQTTDVNTPIAPLCADEE